MAKGSLTPLVLHAVVESEGLQLPAPDLRAVAFRGLTAIVGPADGTGAAGTSNTAERLTQPGAVADHRAIVESLFRQGSVLPVPPGTVARGEEPVERWLELHSSALREALGFVEGRCGARVHVTRVTHAAGAASVDRPLDTPPVDLDAVAAEVFRSLRRHAAASLTLRPADGAAGRISAAFLVESDRWSAFAEALASEARRDTTLRLELSGPWPPYDFVKMQFGG